MNREGERDREREKAKCGELFLVFPAAMDSKKAVGKRKAKRRVEGMKQDFASKSSVICLGATQGSIAEAWQTSLKNSKMHFYVTNRDVLA